MDIKKLLLALGFKPKNDAVDVYAKAYQQHNGYVIEVDFSKKSINYGEIVADCKTTQNFSQDENWVVLECVDRLLEKGYKPQNIVLEKIYPSGHGHSGRLDILVTKNTKAFLMIECKTWGKEFDKELKNIEKDGGQLFTYFQNDKDSEYLILYTSRLNNNKVEYLNEIIKIEEYYKQASNVVDTYERWNKQTYSNGIFENWVNIYCYKNKALTKSDLLELTEENSGKIFHGFLSILRKHSVSDKPNAFNKIFNLFLAKIYDEKKRDNDILDFQWLEDIDNPVDFQVRLYNLHKAGLYEFLKKEIEGISDDDFKYESEQELLEKKKKLLKFNKVFDIKDVIDDESFDDNFKVLKEVVQLLEKYQIRYPRKQQHLSDFFERLLTTGLKQEAGQFFTPPPITKFIAKSIPLDVMISESVNQPIPKLPAVIDYAAGSGHFITEIMEAYQDCINTINTDNFYPEASTAVNTWRLTPYSWAGKYVYGIEKDYRLVKVAKVGCYFYGDGLAQVIHGDGLDSFKYSKNYVGLLSENIKIEDSQKAKFSIVISNPPYSVDAFKGDIKNINVGNEFELYKYLTDRSSEIECLFVERTKQLLKDGGIAGIILPSSILTNSGIYTKTRELLLKYFEIVGITELGSNTFMATGTNTVVLFLRRRNNYECINLQKSVDKFFTDFIDVTVNEIEIPVSKYVSYVWEGLTFEDYITLLEKNPNDKVKNHDLYKEYSQKIKQDKEFWNKVIAAEKEKLYYFILAYPQKVVIIKTGEKDAEKQFLGYEFSNRRGSEGIHAIQKGKSIDDCTRLFDINSFDNPQKASTYIYKAFKNENIDIDESLKDNISKVNLLDMMTFDRADFEKTINVKAKKKIKIESKWELSPLGDVCKLYQPKTISVKEMSDTGQYDVWGANGIIGKHEKYNHKEQEIVITCRGNTSGTINYTTPYSWITGNAMVAQPYSLDKVKKKYLFEILKNTDLSSTITGKAQPQITRATLSPVKIPLPPIDIQQKIVDEIEEIEKKIKLFEKEIHSNKNKIYSLFDNYPVCKLHQFCKIKKEKCKPQKNVEYYYIGLEHIESNNGKINEVIENGTNLLSEKNTYNPNCVLYGKLRPYLNKVGIANHKGVCSTDIVVLETDKPILLKYMLLSDNFVEQAKKKMKGVNHPRINIQDLLNLDIPLPPLSAQQEIVTQIEKLEKQIDEAQKSIDASEKLKNAVLKKYL